MDNNGSGAAKITKYTLTSGQVAERLGIDRRTVQRLVEEEELAALIVGRQYRFAEEALADYIARHSVGRKADTNG